MEEKVFYRGNIKLEELQQLMRKWLRRAAILIIGECEVDYVGRASSKASSSWRLVIIKEDGTVLIHESVGREPINWQPSSYVTTELKEDTLIIRAVRLRPREELVIRLRGECEVLVVKLGVGKFVMSGTEKDIIEFLTNNPRIIDSNAELISREVSTPHGRIDLVLRRKDNTLILVEVKRDVADIEAVFQLRRYVEYYTSLGVSNVKGVIIAQSITPAARKLLSDFGLEYRCIKVGEDGVYEKEIC
ncbi:MAG: endonuclease NucS domain-containing protein [Desulfurococcaceae archaeon TW002]